MTQLFANNFKEKTDLTLLSTNLDLPFLAPKLNQFLVDLTGDLRTLADDEFAIGSFINDDLIEIVKIIPTGSTTFLRMIRGQENTSARTWPIGTEFRTGFTKQSIENIKNEAIDTAIKLIVPNVLTNGKELLTSQDGQLLIGQVNNA